MFFELNRSTSGRKWINSYRVRATINNFKSSSYRVIVSAYRVKQLKQG